MNAADQAQVNVNNTMMMSALTVIPSVIGIIGSLSTITASWTAIQGAAAAATEGLSVAMDFLSANPIVLVIAGIAALAIGFMKPISIVDPSETQ